MFLASTLFALFYCFSLSVFNLQCSSWGPARLGVVSGLAAVGAVPWTVPARVTRGLCTLVWGLLPAQAGVVSVAMLPAAFDRDLSQCGWPPKVASSMQQVLLPNHVSLVTATVCVVVSVCISVYVSVHVCGGGLGSFNFLLLILFCCLSFSAVVYKFL